LGLLRISVLSAAIRGWLFTTTTLTRISASLASTFLATTSLGGLLLLHHLLRLHYELLCHLGQLLLGDRGEELADDGRQRELRQGHGWVVRIWNCCHKS
jgi:hypothetical protein